MPAIIDSGDRDALRELDELLRDNPALQDEYVQYVSVHFLLQLEVHPLGLRLEPLCDAESGATTVHGPSAVRPLGKGARSVPDGQATREADIDLARESDRPRLMNWLAPSVGVSRLPIAASIAAVMVAVLAVGAMGAALATYSISAGLWRQVGHRYTAEEITAAEAWLAKKRLEEGSRFGRLTSASIGMWAGIRPSPEATVAFEAGVGQGLVSMAPLNGSTGEGFVLALPAGHGLEVIAHSESTSENTLVVKRLSRWGVPTGHAHSFSSRDIPSLAQDESERWQVGRVGYWADFNEYDETRYYLLCGVNRDRSDGDHAKWRYSRFRPLQSGPQMYYLGWDDQGVRRLSVDGNVTSRVDQDYDDISAIIRIHRPQDLSNSDIKRVVTAPPRLPVSGQVMPLLQGASIHIEPRESVVLHVNAEVSTACDFYVVEETDSRVWWKLTIPTDSVVHELYAIDNWTDESLSLRLVAVSPATEALASTDALNHEAVVVDDDFSEVNFYQSAASDRPAFDVHVGCHWIR